MDRKFRNFIFTHNNYVGTDLQDSLECRYISYSEEIGDSGTPHLQGLVCFKNATTTKSVIKKLPGCHVEPMVGTIDQAEGYFNGSGKHGGPAYEPVGFTQRGDRPLSNYDKGTAERLRWRRLKQLAKDCDMDQIDTEFPKESFLNYNLIRKIGMDYMKHPDDLKNVCGYWIYGPTRTGKSSLVREFQPNITKDDLYLKQANKWWIGYDRQPYVLIEDLGQQHHILGHYLKIWADKYSFPCETKFGGMCIRPRKIFITSNYHPDDIGFSPGDLPAIKERFELIHKETQEQWWQLA